MIFTQRPTKFEVGAQTDQTERSPVSDAGTETPVLQVSLTLHADP